MISTEDIEAIARRVVELQAEQSMRNERVLTRAEARAYVKRESEAAFHDWCKRWRIKAAVHGRYSRDQLDLALERESRLRAA